MIIQSHKFVLCVEGIFNLKCLIIEFVILNLNQIYFCIPEIMLSKNFYEIFVFKISGIQRIFLNIFLIYAFMNSCLLLLKIHENTFVKIVVYKYAGYLREVRTIMQLL